MSEHLNNKIICLLFTAVWLVSGSGFAATYYVNDVSTNGDVYCTAPGDAVNDGLSAATPDRSVQNIVNDYVLTTGDIVYIDTGLYTNETITVTAADQGASADYVYFLGSTNYAAGGTVFDRNSGSDNVWYLNACDYIYIADITVQGGQRGVYFYNTPEYNRLVNVVSRSNTTAYTFFGGRYNTFFRCRAEKCSYGFRVTGATKSLHVDNRWDNCVFYENTAQVRAYADSFKLSNSVVVGGTLIDNEDPTVPWDYNIFWDLTIGGSYNNLYELQKDKDTLWNSTYINPQFVDAETGDFHLKSVEGAWSNGSWAVYADHSPAIDFGDPARGVTNEPDPDGGRMNAGYFGNTEQASKSRTNAWLLALSFNDGGTLVVPFDAVYWNYGAIATDETVRIEMSLDGTTWEPDPVATGLAVTAQSFTWANTNFISTTSALWRVVLESDTNVQDACDTTFEQKNGGYIYYINDSSTAEDGPEWGIGNDSNSGNSKAEPKATLQSLINNYALAPGDRIVCGAGTYTLVSDQTFTSVDSGSTNGYIQVVGSTNTSAGGTIFRNASLNVDGADYIWFSGITVRNSDYGIDLNNADNIRIDNCVLYDNSRDGVRLRISTAILLNSVLWKNDQKGVNIATTGNASMTNCVVVASGNGAACLYSPDASSIHGDYNNLYAESNAVVGTMAGVNGNIDTLSAWQYYAVGQENSLSVNPEFADPVSFDFHLRSAYGRYLASTGWVTDTVTSRLIDAGDPGMDFSDEPATNGHRINIGRYGNTDQASRSTTSAWLYAASPASGGWMKGTGVFHWVAGGAATSHNVHVELSTDGGYGWADVSGTLPATNETFAWNTYTTNDSPACLWRIVSETDGAVSNQTASFFAVRNNSLNLYVNDADTASDIYCSVVGSATNYRALSTAPLDCLGNVFSLFDLEPGDQVYVDTGSYTCSVSVAVNRLDSGSSANRVKVTGSTNDINGTSLIDTNGTIDLLESSYASYVYISNMVFSGGADAVALQGGSGCRLDRIRIENAENNGLSADSVNALVLKNSMIRNCGAYGVSGLNGTVTILQSLLWSNDQGAIYMDSGTVLITNSVVHASGAGRFLFDLDDSADLISDYNNLLIRNDAFAADVNGRVTRSMVEWQNYTSNDVSSLSHEPLFADAADGDFHIASTRTNGRYVPGAGYSATDTTNSPMIDAGSPSFSVGNEPAPNNGNRINIGPYGGIYQASLSPTGGWFTAVSYNGNVSIRGTNWLYWIAGGEATGWTVNLQFSLDQGSTWSNIALGITGTNRYEWDTGELSAPQVLWRVIETSSNVFDVTDDYFQINNGPISYYVNDSSTNGDVYTAAVGSGANPGTDPYVPKASIQQVLDAYIMRPGDMIFVDTGEYSLSAPVRIEELVGDISNRFMVAGSTNWTAGGTVLDAGGAEYGLVVTGTAYAVIKNLTINNADTALQVSYSTNTLVQWIRSEHGDAVSVSFEVYEARDTLFEHCLAYRGQYGMYQTGSGSLRTRWVNSVCWSNDAAAFYMGAGGVTLTNSIVGVSGSGRYVFEYAGGAGIYGDYNNYVLSDGARMAIREVSDPDYLIHETLSRWARDQNTESHSLSSDPLFVNAGGLDFHLRSQAGHFSDTLGVFTNDTVSSPLIDAGFGAVTNEPDFHGGFVNIGLYGNSDWASKTPTNSLLTTITVNDGGRFEGTNWLYWTLFGAITGDTLAIEYSSDDGSNWASVTTGVPATNRAYEWNSIGYTSSILGVWRITGETLTGVSDHTDTNFALRNNPLYFYVNDAGTADDVYCSAIGSVSNRGVDPSAPMRTAQQVLDTYDLEGGDIVYVDSGSYTNTPLSIGYFDRGEDGNPMILRGSTNEWGTGTRLDHVYVSIQSADDISLSCLTVSNTTTAVYIYNSDDAQLEWLRVRTPGTAFNINESPRAVFRHCVSEKNGTGVNMTKSAGIQWLNGVFWSNTQYAAYLDKNSSFTMSNSVAVIGGADRAVFYSQGGSIKSDFNNILLRNNARVAVRDANPFDLIYENVGRWATDYGQDTHSLSLDPLFADPAASDYHLMSAAPSGRYSQASGWTNDAMTSPLIDAGFGTFTNEPPPNGARLNIGLYGDTPLASRTPTNGMLTAVSYNDGGIVVGVVDLFWAAQGAVTGHTVALDFSFDGGRTWSNLASNVTASAGAYTWTSTNMPSTPVGVWRVRSETNAAIWDVTDSPFALRNEPLTYYVNDTNTVGDVYTTSIGSETNTGAFPDEPLLKLSSVIATYDLEAGDTVFVDTGLYVLTNINRITWLDAGEDTNRVWLIGSTNDAFGGSHWKNRGFYIEEAEGIALSHHTVSNAAYAVTLSDAAGAWLEWVRAVHGTKGFVVEGDSVNAALRHVLAMSNSNYAVEITDGSADVRHSTFWNNGTYTIYADSSLTVSNTVIGVSKANRYAYYYRPSSPGQLASDYNNIFLTNGARAAYWYDKDLPEIYESVSRWARDFGQDRHSLSHDPLFDGTRTFGFHLKTQHPVGRYLPGYGWTNDTVTSPLIDAGFGPGTNELAPNGARANIGMYGDSWQASQTPTNAYVTAVTINDGGRFEGSNTLYWSVSGDATNDLLTLEYSADYRTGWQTIATGIAASARQYAWDSDQPAYTSSIVSAWRLVSEDDPSVTDRTDVYWALRNDPLKFYVNNADTSGDIYCTAIGNSANDGIHPNRPKLSIQAILDAWDMEGGDTLYVDTGSYSLGSQIRFDRFDRGTSTNRVTVLGNTNLLANGTVLSRSGSGNIFYIYQTRGIALRHMCLNGGTVGVNFYESPDCLAEWLLCENADTAFYVEESDDVELSRNVVKSHDEQAVYSSDSAGLSWNNGISWSNNYGIYLDGGNISVGHSVFVIGDDDAGYYINGGTVNADYNDLYIPGAGLAGLVKGGAVGGGTTRYISVSAWIGAGYDNHSLAADPKFFDPLNDDYHIKSMGGRYQAGSGYVTNDVENSSLIDAGDPAADADQEPFFNGGRRNIGLYGNTAQASKTPTNGVAIISFNDNGFASGDIDLTWIAYGTTATQSLRIDVSVDNGSTWTTLVDGIAASNLSYTWDSSTVSNSPFGRWRIQGVEDTNVLVTSDSRFYIRNPAIYYYVNDNSTVGDVYTTAVGNDGNDGISPSAPKASIQSVIDSYALRGGDIVYVDSGTYNLSADIYIDYLDYGVSTNPLIIQGSTSITARTTIDRQSGSGKVFDYWYTTGIELRDCSVQDAANGVYLDHSPGCTFVRVISRNNSQSGMYLDESNAEFEYCTIWENGARGIYQVKSSALFDKGVIWGDSQPKAFELSSSSCTVSNSALKASGSAGRVYDINISSSVKANYNNYQVTDGAYVGEKDNVTGGNSYFPTVTDFRLRYGQDERSLMHAPKFADEDSGDFHLKSATGRLSGTNWVQDAEFSPMIDTGPPLSVYTNEPTPNGTNINLGLYGNTWQASMSETNPWLLAVSWNDGATFSGSNVVYWRYGNIAPTSTVKILYSDNAGLSWQTIISDLYIDSDGYLLNLGDKKYTQEALWRIRSNIFTNEQDTVDQTFTVRNEPQVYYVNDTNTIGDIYCTAAGDLANSGTNAASPLPSPQVLMDTYLLAAGDIIYIDTGYYEVTNNWVLNQDTRGEDGDPITFYGSTNRAFGGSVLDWGYRGNGLTLSETRYISIYDVTISKGNVGVYVDNSVDSQLTRVTSLNNGGTGFRVVSLSNPTTLDHCLAVGNAGYGIYYQLSQGSIDHCVAYSNVNGSVYLRQASPSVNNCIFHAEGAGNHIYTVYRATPNADYNVYMISTNAGVAYDEEVAVEYSTMLAWQDEINDDGHSLLSDPAAPVLFADPSNNDFHTRSKAGRWQDGVGWTNDAATSWAIDAGDPSSPYANESAPNGGRVNAGIMGNRWDASRSDTSTPEVLCLSLRDGGDVTSWQYLRWLYRGINPTNTVELQYSLDAGASWSNVASGIALTVGEYSWYTPDYGSTPVGLWRVYLSADSNIVDRTTNTFFMRNGPIDFYVNDTNLNGDVYAVAAGSATNTGTSPSSPMNDPSLVLSTYDLEAGDRIFVDGGYYPRSGNLTLSVNDIGSAAYPVEIIGSTNAAAPSVVDFTNAPGQLYFNQVDFVNVRNLVLTNGTVYFNKTSSCGMYNMEMHKANGRSIELLQASQTRIDHVLMSPHAGSGIYGSFSSGIRVENSLFWCISNNVIDLTGGSVTISNSIMIVEGDNRYCYAVNPINGGDIKADYNNIIVTNGAFYAIDQAELIYEGLPQWITASEQDKHSLSHDSLFIGVYSNNYRLQSVTGRFVPASNGHVAVDAAHSPLIDTGSSAVYTNEPAPNGSRINIGPYGNTHQASMSRTNPWVLAVSANSGGRIEGTYTLVWGGGGLDPTNRVVLEYSYDDGSSWVEIASNDVKELGDYEYIWDSAVSNANEWYLSSPIARWRISLRSDSNVVDMTDQRFSLRNYPFTFFVNDDSTSNDVYTTAVGNDTNVGFFAWAPKRTIQSMLDDYDFEAGDNIKIDTGVYSTEVTVATSDNGDAGAPFSLIGSTNGGDTRITSENAGISVQGDYVRVRHMTFAQGADISSPGSNNRFEHLACTNAGITISGNSCLVSNIVMFNDNINLSSCSGADIMFADMQNGRLNLSASFGADIHHVLIRGGAEPVISMSDSYNNTIRNSTISCLGTVYRQSGGSSDNNTLENNILIADGMGEYCIQMRGGTLPSLNYNNYVTRNNAWIGNRLGGVGQAGSWERLSYWQEATGGDAGSLSVEPQFVSEGGGNYHLRSVSPCIDAGDPTDPVLSEPDPNGGRINLGRYGGTDQAATGSVALVTVTADDGGVVRGSGVSLAWNAVSVDPTNTVTVEYSPDNRQSWTVIGAGIPVTNGSVNWDTTGITNSLFTYWRITVDADPSIAETNTQRFAVRNNPLAFYVNDANTTGDIYCTAPGSITNSGLSPSQPRESLQSILGLGSWTYDTEPGDTVYVDTGLYSMTNDARIYWSRSAFDATNFLTIQGSTNQAEGGSRMHRGSIGAGADAIEIMASHVNVRDLTLAAARNGIFAQTNTFIYADRCRFESNTFAVTARTTYDMRARNSIMWRNTSGGAYYINVRTGIVEYCTVYGSQNSAFRMENAVYHVFKNNIISMLDSGDDVLVGTTSDIYTDTEIDYNVYQLVANATIYLTNRYLRQWQNLTGHDYRSWTNPPTFADTAAGDFHLVSSNGRYSAVSGWVTDAVSSVGIDCADPADPYANETYYNGARANVGAYGNTEQASRSDTNILTQLRSLTGGEQISYGDFVWPLIWHVVNWPTDVTVRVEASGDSGAEWRLLTNGLPVYREYYIWQLNPFDNTYDGRWRIVGEGAYSNWVYDTTNDFEAFPPLFQITNFFQTTEGLNKIEWEGSWGTWYRVEYTTNAMYRWYEDQIWNQCVSGTNQDERAFFQAVIQGGPMEFVDVETGADTSRWYRVIRLSGYNPSNSIVTTTNLVYVPENGTSNFGVRLLSVPTNQMTVTVSRVSGDTDINVSGGSSLIFNSGNWSVWQTVTLSAADDLDAANSAAVIRCESPGQYPVDVSAVEIDDDGTADQDGDGMPDDYETEHWGGPTNGMPYADDDGDTIHNLGEYISGTIPTNGQSYLQLNYYPAPGTNVYVLYWNSVSNRLYGIFWKTSLFQPFNPWVTNIPASPPMNTYTDDVHDAGANNMYRLTVEME